MNVSNLQDRKVQFEGDVAVISSYLRNHMKASSLAHELLIAFFPLHSAVFRLLLDESPQRTIVSLSMLVLA